MALCIAFMEVSCNKDVLYSASSAIPGNTWVAEQPMNFDVPVSDTLNKYNIFINLRNESDYEFSNLYLFIDIYSPGHVVERDTMECILYSPEGRPLGRGLGDILDNKILFKQNVRFRAPGIYEFKLTQAMRMDSLPMIMDAGITIETVKNL